MPCRRTGHRAGTGQARHYAPESMHHAPARGRLRLICAASAPMAFAHCALIFFVGPHLNERLNLVKADTDAAEGERLSR